MQISLFVFDLKLKVLRYVLVCEVVLIIVLTVAEMRGQRDQA